MLLVLLIIILCMIGAIEYKLNNKELCSPPILFIVPFIIACIVCLLFSKEWNFQLHSNTFFVIIVGCLAFNLGNSVAKKIKLPSKKNENYNGIYDRNIETWKYYIFIFFELLCYLWKLKCIKNYGSAHGYTTLPSAINYYNYVLKFTTDELIYWPKILSIGLKFCLAAGFVWSCILAQKLVQKKEKRKNLILTLINFAICLIGSMTSGGRGGAVQLIMAFLCAYLIMYSREHDWKIKIPYKIMLKIVILVLITAYGFIFIMNFIGRQEIHMIGKYLANYIGAQIHNLDYFLNVSFRRSVIFGQETFQPIIQFIAGKLGIEQWSRYNLDIPSIYVNSRTLGYISLGNVCTAFYSYIHDFGYIGVLILPFIIGFLSQLFYKAARNSKINRVQNLGLILYSNISYALIFSFFSNKFFELIFIPSTVTKIIAIYIILYFLYNVTLGYKAR